MQRAALCFVLVAMIGCGQPTIEPFRRLDLQQGCALYFLRSEASLSGFNLQHGSFCLHDKRQISRLMKSWRFKTEHDPTSCGYEYTVYVLQNDKPVTQLNLNGPCGYVITENGWYDFDTLLYDEIEVGHLEHIDTKTADSLDIALNALFGP